MQKSFFFDRERERVCVKWNNGTFKLDFLHRHFVCGSLDIFSHGLIMHFKSSKIEYERINSSIDRGLDLK